MDFGLGFHCGANQSRTAAGHKITKSQRHLCVGCSHERLGVGTVAQGLGAAARATKSLSGWCPGLSPMLWYQPVPGSSTGAWLSSVCALCQH